MQQKKKKTYADTTFYNEASAFQGYGNDTVIVGILELSTPSICLRHCGDMLTPFSYRRYPRTADAKYMSSVYATFTDPFC